MSEQRHKKFSYRDAGLDLDLYEQSLAGMVPFLKRTHTPRVLDGFGDDGVGIGSGHGSRPLHDRREQRMMIEPLMGRRRGRGPGPGARPPP